MIKKSPCIARWYFTRTVVFVRFIIFIINYLSRRNVVRRHYTQTIYMRIFKRILLNLLLPRPSQFQTLAFKLPTKCFKYLEQPWFASINSPYQHRCRCQQPIQISRMYVCYFMNCNMRTKALACIGKHNNNYLCQFNASFVSLGFFISNACKIIICLFNKRKIKKRG